MHAIATTLIALAIAFVVAAPASAQPYAYATEIAERVTITPFVDFELEYETTPQSCLENCMVVVTERTELDCSPRLALPTSGCDLPWGEPAAPPWIGGFHPTPLPWDDIFSCIPEDATIVGWNLFEDRQLVEQFIHHKSDCTTTVKETVLEVLPPTGESDRSCPDVGGWRSVEETPVSTMYWVACPAD